MKNLMKYGFIAFVICFLFSCDINKVRKEQQESQAEDFNVVVYNGCEYVSYSKKLAHKGNCKNPIHNCR